MRAGARVRVQTITLPVWHAGYLICRQGSDAVTEEAPGKHPDFVFRHRSNRPVRQQKRRQRPSSAGSRSGGAPGRI